MWKLLMSEFHPERPEDVIRVESDGGITLDGTWHWVHPDVCQAVKSLQALADCYREALEAARQVVALHAVQVGRYLTVGEQRCQELLPVIDAALAAGRDPAPPAASEEDDDWTYTTEAVDPQDPLLSGPRWREALQEIVESRESFGDDTLYANHAERVAYNALNRPAAPVQETPPE